MNSSIVVVIAGCEIGFWVLVALGLAARYLLHRPVAGNIVLALVPVLDVVLLIAVAADLHRGSEVGGVHRIAGLYLGISVAFGPRLVRWADERFAHRFAGGPTPVKPPRRGPQALRRECIDFGRWLVAATISAATVLGLQWTVADTAQAQALRDIFPMLGVITVIWLVTGPVWVLGRG